MINPFPINCIISSISLFLLKQDSFSSKESLLDFTLPFLYIAISLLFIDFSRCFCTLPFVLDGFLGSATTLIASEQLDRICYGVELEPKFVDVAVKRYIEFKNGNKNDVTVIRDGEENTYDEAVAEMEDADGTTE